MTTINATKQEFVNLINGLYQVQEVKGKQFSLLISKNIDILKTELKSLEEAATPSEEFMVLAKKVNELANSKEEEAKSKIDKLEEENKELVEARRVQMETIQKMMEEKLEIKLNSIDEKVLPEDVTAKQINGIIKLIK
tara:strand:+ start:403 stop:816 length:414 start_codon:yes stop_codon:yes gene_type:complete